MPKSSAPTLSEAVLSSPPLPEVVFSSPRCPGCRMPPGHCLCQARPRLKTETAIVIVSQWTDHVRPSNTGHLAHSVLENSSMLIRGLRDQPLPQQLDLAPETRLLVLYAPGPDRAPPEVLGTHHGAKGSGPPTTLLVPDGSWTQSRRMMRREALFAAAQTVVLPPGPPSRYRLRCGRHAHELSTYEAIARALALLEDDLSLLAAMLPIFDQMVETLLRVRGRHH